MASAHAAQAHTSFIKVDRALRNALAARTVDDFDRHAAAAENAAGDVLSDLDVVAEQVWDTESTQLVNGSAGPSSASPSARWSPPS